MSDVANTGDRDVKRCTFCMRLVNVLPGWRRQNLHTIVTAGEQNRTENVDDGM